MRVVRQISAGAFIMLLHVCDAASDQLLWDNFGDVLQMDPLTVKELCVLAEDGLADALLIATQISLVILASFVRSIMK